jgi:hypothetical protein
VEGNAILASIGTLLVALVFFRVISVAPPERHTDTFPVSQSTPAFLAEYTRPLAPSVMEIVNGFPSFSVVSSHLVLTLFVLTSLTVLKHSALASVGSIRINRQVSHLKFLRTMFISSGIELHEVA